MQTPNESLLTLDKVCCKRINESCFPSRPTFFFFFFFLSQDLIRIKTAQLHFGLQ